MRSRLISKFVNEIDAAILTITAVYTHSGSAIVVAAAANSDGWR